jgi:hypothetical protein
MALSLTSHPTSYQLLPSGPPCALSPGMAWLHLITSPLCSQSGDETGPADRALGEVSLSPPRPQPHLPNSEQALPPSQKRSAGKAGSQAGISTSSGRFSESTSGKTCDSDTKLTLQKIPGLLLSGPTPNRQAPPPPWALVQGASPPFPPGPLHFGLWGTWSLQSPLPGHASCLPSWTVWRQRASAGLARGGTLPQLSGQPRLFLVHRARPPPPRGKDPDHRVSAFPLCLHRSQGTAHKCDAASLNTWCGAMAEGEGTGVMGWAGEKPLWAIVGCQA